MIVGIDAHAVGGRSSGNETYYEQLVKHLADSTAGGISYLVYYTHAVGATKIPVSEKIRIKRIRPSWPMVRIPCSFPLEFRREKVDVFHAQFIVPPFCKCKAVTTIPDIAYEHFPELFSSFETVRSKILIRRSAKLADHIITVSKYSKDDLVRTYDIDPHKITVTYGAASPVFRPRDSDSCKEQIHQKYGIDAPFFLYVGRLQARKNLPRLLRAFARLNSEGVKEKLVVVGKRDWMLESVAEQVKGLKLQQSVVFTGYVPSEDLPLFYGGAEVFLYPSIFEGFGLPVMEAMASGTPVMTSFGSSLEEIAGDAALLVDPYSEESIANGLRRLVSDAGLRALLRVNGLRRSSAFSYEQTAQRTIDVYKNVVGAL